MDLIFVLVTQLINLTTSNVVFEVDRGRRLLPELPPGKTRFVKQSRILRRLGESEDWKIRVFLDGEFTGMELDPLIVLKYVRLVFRVDRDVLWVYGVRENLGSDVLFRHRYFGCMRNFYWNRRPLVRIDSSDSKSATKLRNAEGDRQYLTPFVDITLQKRYASPPAKSPGKNTRSSRRDHRNKEDEIKGSPAQQPRPRTDKKIVKSGEQTSSSDDENKHNATVADQQRRPWSVPRPLDLQRRPGEQTSTDGNVRATHQQNEAEIRRRPGKQTRSDNNEDNMNSPQPNDQVTHQQIRPRDPRPYRSSGQQTSNDNNEDDFNSPRHNARATHQQARPESMPPNVAAAQQARPRDDEPPMNVVEKDSFVHGIILALALMIGILISFLFNSYNL